MLTTTRKLNKIGILSWCLFDWAIGPYSVLITTFIFATYFTEKVAADKIIGTTLWGEANGFAGLIVAFMSPILGAIADYEGRRKPWLLFLTPVIMISSALLWFVKPSVESVHFALFWIIVGTAALETSSVFYNAMLNELSPRHLLGRLSGWGWGSGYAGGVLALIITLELLNHSSFESVRFCGPIVAIWILLFSWPLFVFTPDRPSTGLGLYIASKKGLISLGKTLKILHLEYRNIFLFLVARMIYIDGLVTAFAFGGIYAAGVFNMQLSEVIMFGIAANIAAGIGAAIFGWLDDLKGAKLTILCSLLLMIIFGMGMILTQSKIYFWIFGLGLSLGVGPTQAASRSLMIRISPDHLMTELFGLYNLSGRVTSFLGPWVVALVTHWFSSQRAGMSTVFLFVVIGGAVLLFVKAPKPRSQ